MPEPDFVSVPRATSSQRSACWVWELMFTYKLISSPVNVSWLPAEDLRLMSQRQRTVTPGTANCVNVTSLTQVSFAPPFHRGDMLWPRWVLCMQCVCIADKVHLPSLKNAPLL